MPQLAEEEQIKKIKGSESLCICQSCPTYNKCAQEEGELVYCLIGASPSCITEEVGCICPACPLWEKMDFKNEYYCTKGTEIDQRRNVP